MQAQVTENVKNEISEVDIRIIDIDKNRPLANEHDIKAVPTFVFVKNGKAVDRHSGMISSQDLKRKISEIYGI